MSETEPKKPIDPKSVRLRRGILGLGVFLVLATLVVGRGDLLGLAIGSDGEQMGCGGGGGEETVFLEADSDGYISATPVTTNEQGLRSYRNCTHAYSKENFEGTHYTFWCGGKNSTGWNDKIQSIKIPANRKLTVYEHSGQRGKYAALAGDMRKLGEFKKMISSLHVTHFDTSKCVVGWRHKNYSGAKTYFCAGSRAWIYESWNDEISSFQIPAKQRVKVCTDKDGTLCRTFFKSVPWVGKTLNDKISWVSRASFNPKDFMMVLMSDPQYDYCNSCWCRKSTGEERTDDDGKVRKDKKGNPKIYCNDPNNANGPGNADVANDWHVKSIRKVQQKHGSQFAGVIINGDITHLELNSELSKYKENYEHRFRFNVYPGLGNHDYDNYQDKYCWANRGGGMYGGCTMNILDWFRTRIDSIPTRSKDVKTVGSGWTRDHYAGSLAYSFNIGAYHFVQLNNHPHYNQDIGNTLGWDSTPYYKITKSLEWLKKDLAAHKKKRTILNLHVMSTDESPKIDRFSKEDGASVCDADCVEDFGKFTDIIDDNRQIQAIFAGHMHSWVGSVRGHITTGAGREVPVYFGGGAEYNHYLRVRFQKHQLTIDSVDSTKGDAVQKSSETLPVVMP